MLCGWTAGAATHSGRVTFFGSSMPISPITQRRRTGPSLRIPRRDGRGRQGLFLRLAQQFGRQARHAAESGEDATTHGAPRVRVLETPQPKYLLDRQQGRCNRDVHPRRMNKGPQSAALLNSAATAQSAVAAAFAAIPQDQRNRAPLSDILAISRRSIQFQRMTIAQPLCQSTYRALPPAIASIALRSRPQVPSKCRCQQGKRAKPSCA